MNRIIRSRDTVGRGARQKNDLRRGGHALRRFELISNVLHTGQLPNGVSQ
jgi:hypothetical protein